MERCALTREAELKRYTRSLGMIWISTFSRAAADFLQELDVPAYKIAPARPTTSPDPPHRAQGEAGDLSTGMQTIGDHRLDAILGEAGIDYALLECTNLYPSPPEIVSLKGVTELRNAFQGRRLASTHSIGPEMALASVALGASIWSGTTPTPATQGRHHQLDGPCRTAPP